jgi:hypothetical protein
MLTGENTEKKKGCLEEFRIINRETPVCYAVCSAAEDKWQTEVYEA